MMSFKTVFEKFSWEATKAGILSKTAADVEQALQKEQPDLEDFKALVSPQASFFLEAMAKRSHYLTRKRFGNIQQLYVPLYLSNECQNICTYCGFSFSNDIKRKTLSDEEILTEARAIKTLGFDHVLLVTGESGRHVGLGYLKNAMVLLRPFFSRISIEVQPLEQQEYAELQALGLNAVLVYQETYHKEKYSLHHPKGKKSNFFYRLDTPDRLGKAFLHKIGLGVLLGLEDWRTDSFFTALHLDYLQKTYWQTSYSISFPRLRPAQGVYLPQGSVTDKDLVQLICAYRIFNPELELSLSTRESEKFRNHSLRLGITSMSAGSKTNPGGYAAESDSLEQFEISDNRSPAQVAEMMRENGYEPVWKDWELFK